MAGGKHGGARAGAGRKAKATSLSVDVLVRLWFLLQVELDTTRKRSIRDASDRLAKELSSWGRTIDGSRIRKLCREAEAMLRSLHQSDSSFAGFRENSLGQIRFLREKNGHTTEQAVCLLIADLVSRRSDQESPEVEIKKVKARLAELEIGKAAIEQNLRDLDRQRLELLSELSLLHQNLN